MEHLSMAILLLCLSLNAASLLLFHYLLKDLSGEMAELRTLARRAYLQTSYLYHTGLLKARNAAIEREDYEFARRIDNLIRSRMREMEDLLK